MSEKVKILIVDDQIRQYSAVSYMLEDKGYGVMMVDEGYKAVEMVKLEKFDLALVDVNMPGINGLEVLRKIKCLSPSTVVVMITASGFNEDLLRQAFCEGVYTVVYKPFDMAVLMGIIEKILKNKSASGE